MTNEDKSVVWAFVGSLVTIKLFTSVMVLYYFPSWHTLMLVVALSIAWFIPPFFYLGLHTHRRYRLVKVRLRRKELMRQEWDVEERSPTGTRRQQ